VLLATRRLGKSESGVRFPVAAQEKRRRGSADDEEICGLFQVIVDSLQEGQELDLVIAAPHDATPSPS
jgi:hypothetical protein